MPGKLASVNLANIVSDRFPDAGIIVASGRLTAQDIALPDSAEFFSKPYSFASVIERFRMMSERKA
jgi:two-component system cell cycle response regulator CpdR